MWEVVDNICSNSDGRKEYITSTEAGKLFNDDGFNETLRKYSNNNGLLKIQTEFKNYMRERIPAVKFLFITMVKRLR